MATSVKSALLGEQHAFHTPDRSSSFTLKTADKSDGRRLDLVSCNGKVAGTIGPVLAEATEQALCSPEALSVSVYRFWAADSDPGLDQAAKRHTFGQPGPGQQH